MKTFKYYKIITTTIIIDALVINLRLTFSFTTGIAPNPKSALNVFTAFLRGLLEQMLSSVNNTYAQVFRNRVEDS